MQNNKSGRSMIEMLGVLAIIGILSAGGIAGYTMAMKSWRANKAMEAFQLASGQILSAFGDNKDFSKIAGNLSKLGVDTESPYGENITASGTNGQFSLYMNNVPQDACIKIAQSPWGDEYTIGVNGNLSQYTNDPYSCNETNEIVFTYVQDGTSAGGGDSGGGQHVRTDAEFAAACEEEYNECMDTCPYERTSVCKSYCGDRRAKSENSTVKKTVSECRAMLVTNPSTAAYCLRDGKWAAWCNDMVDACLNGTIEE